MKQSLEFILPDGVVRMVHTRQERGHHCARAAVLKKSPAVTALSHGAMIGFNLSRGDDRTQATAGTVPESSLAFVASIEGQNNHFFACLGLRGGRGL